MIRFMIYACRSLIRLLQTRPRPRPRQICEDSARELESEELGRPLNQLVPMLLALFSHPKDSFRVMALTCVNSLISLSPQALLLNMDAYLEVGWDGMRWDGMAWGRDRTGWGRMGW